MTEERFHVEAEEIVVRKGTIIEKRVRDGTRDIADHHTSLINQSAEATRIAATRASQIRRDGARDTGGTNFIVRARCDGWYIA